ncbi:beta-1,3-galactosyltransferase 2-like [Chrysemys picta bellii]|uniref:beta-1,3-galactosyltransferase 2-like n=1 Tax=Chrysemys picta bellii TaxID=8478 RepID=UPI000388C738|nr:beta-1,3-galactosyltransferase 2-like [Chrysemys picta bellii]
MRAGFPHKLLFVCVSSFLFLLLVIVHHDAPRTLQLWLSAAPRREPVSAEPLQGSPIFQWQGTEEEKARHSMPVPVPSRPPASTRHPLQVVYPYSYRFLLNEPDKCREWAPFLVLLVVTEPKDIEARNAIRQTWGNESAVPGVSMVRLFLTGVHPHYSSQLQRLLKEESALHRDIIQQDFLDTYNNLTLKTLMGMEWVSRHCPNASYVVKADSDIFLNMGFLVRELLQPQLPPKKDFMTGYIYRNTGPLRSKAYKWYVPREVYPNDTYPPYCGGPGYVLSGDLAKKVYGVAQTLRVINMEDAFMGICLYELGVRVTDSPWGLFNVFWQEYEKCRFSKLVVVHHFGPTDLLRVWPDFLGGNKTCPS